MHTSRLAWNRSPRFPLWIAAVAFLGACGGDETPLEPALPETGVLTDGQVDPALARVLSSHGFTGRMNDALPQRLRRPLNTGLADLGRLLFFDPILGLQGDNSCAGCHAPQHGFGDTQSIAIGIDNNGMVGPGRTGPRNQRRTPQLLNASFYPTLMWNSRFAARSGNPFDNSSGLAFPDPEGGTLSHLPHLLTAQAFIPPTERVEMTGMAFEGDNTAIRAEVARRLNLVAEYRNRFGQQFSAVNGGAPIVYEQVGRAIAEFTFSLRFANAPIDQFARGNRSAMTMAQKRGALLFFGKAGCVRCHAVSGQSNEMFSDFEEHVIGVPQIAPLETNVTWDGPAANEDFGLEQVTRNPADRYAFRTSPIRNVALQPTFGHNGAYTRLADMVRHHLNPAAALASYTPEAAGVAADLRAPRAPVAGLVARLDARLRTPVSLTEEEFDHLMAFVAEGLLDPLARPEQLRRMIPAMLPSGIRPHTFQ